MQQQTQTNQEFYLLDYVDRLDRHRTDRRAVHVRLSRLKAPNRRPHHVRIACHSFESLLNRHDGYLFALSNADIVCIVKGATVAEIDEVVFKLRFLFSEDPISAREEDEPGLFCSWYDLENDYQEFLSAARQLSAEADERRKAAMNSNGAGKSKGGPPPVLVPLAPDHLGRLVNQLSTMDLGALIRRQSIVALVGSAPPQPLFSELFVSIADLQRLVMPDVDLLADRWLFQYVTQILDFGILKLLPEIEPSIPQSTCININIATVLSPQFLEFDHEFRRLTRKTIVLEIQPVDLFGDIGAFMFARDFVRDRGYRVCLDGLSHITFPLLDRKHLGLDLEKIIWSADIHDEIVDARRADLAAAVRAAGPSRVILCRCDGPKAIEFGQSVGITLFQGRHVDRLLDQGGKIPVAAAG